jgi:hypothetical protein
MSHELDQLLGRLAAADVAVPENLEQAILTTIAGRREDRRLAGMLAPVRVASVGLAVAIGISAGGFAAVTTAAEPRRFSTFSADPHLAPSTLLEGRG